MAPIAAGNEIPNGTLSFIDQDNKTQTVSIHTLAANKKVVILGVPGAFTPVCSLKHVPSFMDKADELKAKGVEEIICISVNDVCEVNAWGKTFTENKNVKFPADASGKYTKALDLELDLTDAGLGVRSKRFAMLVDNLQVKVANIGGGGEFTVSGADQILQAL